MLLYLLKYIFFIKPSKIQNIIKIFEEQKQQTSFVYNRIIKKSKNDKISNQEKTEKIDFRGENFCKEKEKKSKMTIFRFFNKKLNSFVSKKSQSRLSVKVPNEYSKVILKSVFNRYLKLNKDDNIKFSLILEKLCSKIDIVYIRAKDTDFGNLVAFVACSKELRIFFINDEDIKNINEKDRIIFCVEDDDVKIVKKYLSQNIFCLYKDEIEKEHEINSKNNETITVNSLFSSGLENIIVWNDFSNIKYGFLNKNCLEKYVYDIRVDVTTKNNSNSITSNNKNTDQNNLTCSNYNIEPPTYGMMKFKVCKKTHSSKVK